MFGVEHLLMRGPVQPLGPRLVFPPRGHPRDPGGQQARPPGEQLPGTQGAEEGQPVGAPRGQPGAGRGANPAPGWRHAERSHHYCGQRRDWERGRGGPGRKAGGWGGR